MCGTCSRTKNLIRGDGEMVNILERPQFRQAWSVVSAGLSIKTEQDYQQAVTLLDRLLDEVGENERHPLFGFLEVLGTLIESYESDHVEMNGATGKDGKPYRENRTGYAGDT